MNKIIKTVLLVIIIGSIFFIGYKLPFWGQKPIPPPTSIEDLKPLPSGSESYIKDGVLYTSVAIVPLAFITKITLNGDTILFVIIEYKYDNHHAGMLAMSYMEYKRLFGDPDVKK